MNEKMRKIKRTHFQNYSYIFPLGRTVMHRLKLSIMFATLGQLVAEILVIL